MNYCDEKELSIFNRPNTTVKINSEVLYKYLCPPLFIGCLISVLLNGGLLIIGHFKVKNKSPILLLSLNLATTDTFSSLFVGIGLFVNSYLPVVYEIQFSTCSLLALEIARMTALISSVSHLFALAFIHYRGIVKPLHYRIFKLFCINHISHGINIMTIISWIVPFLTFTLYFSLIPCQGFQSSTCSYLFLLSKKYRFFLLTTFLIPFILMILIYIRIFIIISKNQKLRSELTNQAKIDDKKEIFKQKLSNNNKKINISIFDKRFLENNFKKSSKFQNSSKTNFEFLSTQNDEKKEINEILDSNKKIKKISKLEKNGNLGNNNDKKMNKSSKKIKTENDLRNFGFIKSFKKSLKSVKTIDSKLIKNNFALDKNLNIDTNSISTNESTSKSKFLPNNSLISNNSITNNSITNNLLANEKFQIQNSLIKNNNLLSNNSFIKNCLLSNSNFSLKKYLSNEDLSNSNLKFKNKVKLPKKLMLKNNFRRKTISLVLDKNWKKNENFCKLKQINVYNKKFFSISNLSLDEELFNEDFDDIIKEYIKNKNNETINSTKDLSLKEFGENFQKKIDKNENKFKNIDENIDENINKKIDILMNKNLNKNIDENIDEKFFNTKINIFNLNSDLEVIYMKNNYFYLNEDKILNKKLKTSLSLSNLNNKVKLNDEINSIKKRIKYLNDCEIKKNLIVDKNLKISSLNTQLIKNISLIKRDKINEINKSNSYDTNEILNEHSEKIKKCKNDSNNSKKMKKKLNKNLNVKYIHKNYKAIFTTLTILGTYLVCWMPALIYLVLTCVDGCAYPLFEIPLKNRVIISFITTCLVIFKSIIDPFIYIYRFKKVKQAVRKCSFYSLFSINQKQDFINQRSNQTIIINKSSVCLGNSDLLSNQTNKNSSDSK